MRLTQGIGKQMIAPRFGNISLPFKRLHGVVGHHVSLTLSVRIRSSVQTWVRLAGASLALDKKGEPQKAKPQDEADAGNWQTDDRLAACFILLLSQNKPEVRAQLLRRNDRYTFSNDCYAAGASLALDKKGEPQKAKPQDEADAGNWQTDDRTQDKHKLAFQAVAWCSWSSRILNT
jgi:hypothetical protein